MAAVSQQPQTRQGGGAQPLLVCNPKGSRDWQTGTLACFSDCKTALMTWCCLPYVLCTLSNKLGDCMCMPCFVPGSVITMRTRTRTLGGIEGSICGDCVCTSVCYLCTVCQLMRELEAMRL